MARRPSRSTVHAPHWPWSQPFFGAITPSRSLSASNSVVPVSRVSDRCAPSTSSVMRASMVWLPRCLAWEAPILSQPGAPAIGSLGVATSADRRAPPTKAAGPSPRGMAPRLRAPRTDGDVITRDARAARGAAARCAALRRGAGARREPGGRRGRPADRGRSDPRAPPSRRARARRVRAHRRA